MARFRYTDDGRYQGRYRPMGPSSGSDHVFPSDWIGIPEPAFGLDETYRMYDDDPGVRNPALTYTASASGGFFTHYVDKSDPNATATGTPSGFGSVAVPMNNVPTAALPEGSIVEVHGGTEYTSGGSRFVWLPQGSETKPVFIRGVDSPTWSGVGVTLNDILINGTYVILEDLTLDEVNFGTRDIAAPWSERDHIVFRGCTLAGDGSTGSAGGFYLQGVDYAVIYDCTVSYHGNYLNDAEDAMGVIIGRDSVELVDSTYIWVLNCHMHHNAADAVQVNGGSYIYIGGNDFHEDGENAVDFKRADHVVVSQNSMYNYNGTEGKICVAQEEGLEQADDIWFIYNKIYNAPIAFSLSSGSKEVYMIGNVIYDISNIVVDSGNYQTTVDEVTYNFDGDKYFLNNTMHDIDKGFQHNNSVHTDRIVVVANNVFGLLGDAVDEYHINVNLHASATETVTDNFFQETEISTPDSVDSIDGEDPLFTNTTTKDFSLQAESNAINEAKSDGVIETAYALFQSTYGLDIRVDIEDTARPVGAEWDMGAYEYSA